MPGSIGFEEQKSVRLGRGAGRSGHWTWLRAMAGIDGAAAAGDAAAHQQPDLTPTERVHQVPACLPAHPSSSHSSLPSDPPAQTRRGGCLLVLLFPWGSVGWSVRWVLPAAASEDLFVRRSFLELDMRFCLLRKPR